MCVSARASRTTKLVLSTTSGVVKVFYSGADGELTSTSLSAAAARHSGGGANFLLAALQNFVSRRDAKLPKVWSERRRRRSK